MFRDERLYETFAQHDHHLLNVQKAHIMKLYPLNWLRTDACTAGICVFFPGIDKTCIFKMAFAAEFSLKISGMEYVL